MNLKSVFGYVKKNGVKNSFQRLIGKQEEIIVDSKKYQILLLTNRDSDNVGDQVIEACDIGLLQAIMSNLGISEKQYVISSSAASIVSRKYIATKDDSLLAHAKKVISNADIIVFGGAPLFNFLYQEFYERTAVTLELAQQYNKPVLFSAIGVEGYSDKNPKCQRLKKTLNFDCVRQITTRDDFECLKQYKDSEHLVIDKVSDPAVFSGRVFAKFKAKSVAGGAKKKIGIFVLRANGFKDNKVDFSREDAAALWKSLGAELENRGYKYEYLTSGHFGDEAFLDLLVKKYGIPEKKCVFGINSPEKLINKISSYDAIVSCRLHPSIIAYSLDVPSVGIIWNNKVTGFYDSMGYHDRTIETKDISPEKIIDKLETAMDQGITKDEDYLASVYRTLFNGFKNVFLPDDTTSKPYTYAELMEKIPEYQGTSPKEMDQKVNRKFRRTYGKYNDLFEKNLQLKKTINELKSKQNQ